VDYRIIATAEDAILAKQATAHAKYYRDPFCHAFCEQSTHRAPRYFQPIIKRGTHARVCCMDRALTAFLKVHASNTNTQKTVEIVVLGAGKDTSYWRLVTKSLMGMEEYLLANPYRKSSLPLLPKVLWKEVDHPSVVHEKAAVIHGSNMLSQCCPNLTPTSQHGYSSVEGNYQLIGADLRDSPQVLLDKLVLNPTIPTLILVECVFMYLPTNPTTQQLLQAIAATHPKVWMALYEPILQHDAFGQMMQQNLIKAQVATPNCGLLQIKTLEEQLQLLIKAGFTRAVGCDMGTAYQTIVTADQRKMANQAEFLDEMEEWTLIMHHYCFVVATTCTHKGDDPLTQVNPNDESSLLGFRSGKCQIVTNQHDDESG
jgi:[phosphatase 2A protein]-leucine-carboxy methyltransferase